MLCESLFFLCELTTIATRRSSPNKAVRVLKLDSISPSFGKVDAAVRCNMLMSRGLLEGVNEWKEQQPWKREEIMTARI